MKPFGHFLLAALAVTTLAACDGAPEEPPVAQTAATEGEAQSVDQAPPAGHAPQAGERLADGAPDFASLYPEAQLTQPVVMADGSDGPGGIAEFHTAASPDDIVAHYRRLAADAGLKPVMSMNQGNARAFAALRPDGAEIQVVASPDGETGTSVQLTWKSGK